MEGDSKKLFLIDAMALIYRAYYSFSNNPRITSKGLNTSAVYGFMNALLDIMKNQQPSHLAVVFDSASPTVRHESYAEYKANRETIPEDIALSIPIIKELISAFNIPVYAMDGYEADDIIGTLAKEAENSGFTTFMMTMDKDFGQLVSDHTFVYKPGKMGGKAEVLGPKEVCERFRISSPSQVIDILGLWGDASDNIPGIPGIGEKRAIELVNKYGNMENVLANLQDFKGVLRENLEKYADQGIHSKQLATIITSVPVPFNEIDLRVKNPDYQKVKALFSELEFKSMASRILGEKPLTVIQGQATLFTDEPGLDSMDTVKNIHNITHRYVGVNDETTLDQLITRLYSCSVFCFDTETTGLNPNESELVGISFSFEKGEAFFLRIDENYHEACNRLRAFKQVFENPAVLKVGQNLKYDISVLKWYDIDVKGPLFDTMLAHYLLEPDMRHNMDFLAEKYLGYIAIPYEALFTSKPLKAQDIRKVDPELLKDYACEDADVTLQLMHIFEPELKKANVYSLFTDIEIPLIAVLASLELEGVKVDTGILKEYSITLTGDIEKLENEIYTTTGVVFNISSPKQLGEVLFDRLKIIDNPKQTKTRQYSTGEDILVKLANKHPVINMILDYRSLTKLKSTYVDALPEMLNSRTGRIHSSFNQFVAATGRLSSNNPNLQNIPIRTERGREIRKAFVPRNESYTLLSADYSQIELRIIAGMSEDKVMMQAFRDGLDIHTATAANIYSIPLNEVSRELRRNAKTVNFGIIYGISAYGLSERLNIPKNEAKTIIDQYFQKFPGIRSYMESTIAFARKNGYVETIMKRRRYIRNINSANANDRGFAERNAINAPIQGSAADMIKLAMISIYNTFLEKNLKSRMILQVHDELVFDVFKDELKIVKEIVHEKMVNALDIKVPVEIDMNVGSNWLEAHG